MIPSPDFRDAELSCGQRHSRVRMALLALSVGLGACSQFEKRFSEDVSFNQQRTVQAQNKLRTPTPLPLVVRDRTPRFASQTMAVQEDQALPSAIGPITLRYPGRHTLLQAADLITRAVKIPVVFSPDALIEPAKFSPVASAAAAAPVSKSQDEKSPSAIRQKQHDANQDFVARQGGGLQGLSDDEYQTSVELNYSGNLEGLLDQIAAKTGLYWRYAAGAITFSRIDTQTFMIKAHPGTAKFSSNVTGTNTENSGGSMSVTSGSDIDFWDGLNQSIKSLVSRSGRYVLDDKNGTVTVIDSVVNVRAVGRLIERYNELSLRQIVLNVEVLQIQLDESKQLGVDWNAVSKQISSMSGAKLSLTGPPALTNASTGSLGLTLTGGNGQLESGRLFINALETFGKVSSAYSVSVTTTNRQPVPVGALNSLSYVKQSSAASTSTAGVITQGSLVPGVVQTGFAMTLVPTILDSNRIMLQSSMTISAIKNLSTFTSGSISVQTPEVDSFNTMQRMSAASGDTIILMGYEREGGSWATNDLTQGAPLPGYRSGKRSKVSTVVLITPLLQDF